MTDRSRDVVPHRVRCGEIWGGNRGDQLEVETSGVRASLFSRAYDGVRGGDVYYFSVCNQDLLTRIAILDVVGHGEGVADVSSWLHESLVRQMNAVDGSVVLDRLNGLATDRGEHALATAAVTAFYRADSRLYVSYAGHNELLYCRHGGNAWRSLRPTDTDDLCGLPLGVSDGCRFHQDSFPCSAGDRLFLFTDGLPEAMDGAGVQFGMDRLLAVLESGRNAPVSQLRQAVLDALSAHTGGGWGHDDVTFMAIEIAGNDESVSDT